jgi:ubiquinone/menaquinone biosynthesis C-methylase UbiE
MPSPDDIKSQAQSRFGQFAESYVQSKSHASGGDLERLIALAQPQPNWRVMDIATGGGHTALKAAPHVEWVVAADLTPRMLQAARTFIQGQEVYNVDFSAADAENLPFAAGVFDLVTCRIAPHHFPDCYRFVVECARVLKPGGLLVVEDNLVPEDDRAARYVDAFERLRDPSHHRLYADYEWQGMFLDAGLSVEQVEHVENPGTKLLPWAERQGCSPEVIERLQILLAQTPAAVSEWMHPRAVGTSDAAFDHHYIIIAGRKAE